MGKKKSRKIVNKSAHQKPFTAQEIVNLKTGFGRYGARWKTILNSFQFQKGRNAEELRVKYENVFKKF